MTAVGVIARIAPLASWDANLLALTSAQRGLRLRNLTSAIFDDDCFYRTFVLSQADKTTTQAAIIVAQLRSSYRGSLP